MRYFDEPPIRRCWSCTWPSTSRTQAKLLIYRILCNRYAQWRIQGGPIRSWPLSHSIWLYGLAPLHKNKCAVGGRRQAYWTASEEWLGALTLLQAHRDLLHSTDAIIEQYSLSGAHGHRRIYFTVSTWNWIALYVLWITTRLTKLCSILSTLCLCTLYGGMFTFCW